MVDAPHPLFEAGLPLVNFNAAADALPQAWSSRVLDSGAPGPHVMINALTHGNELCGAIAVEMLLAAGVRPARGRLALSFANVQAYERVDIHDPDATRFIHEGLNRVRSVDTLDGPGNTLQLRRARELRPVVDTVDSLLDIHSMHEKAEPLMLTGPLEQGVALGRQVGAPSHLMIDAGHAAGGRLRDYGGLAMQPARKRAAGRMQPALRAREP